MIRVRPERCDETHISASRGDPFVRHDRMVPAEHFQTWNPRQQRTTGDPAPGDWIDGVVLGPLGGESPLRARPAIVVHHRATYRASDAPRFGADAEALRIAIRSDVERGPEPHRADLAAIPFPIARDSVKAAVKMSVVDHDAFNARVAVAPLDRLPQSLGTAV